MASNRRQLGEGANWTERALLVLTIVSVILCLSRVVIAAFDMRAFWYDEGYFLTLARHFAATGDWGVRVPGEIGWVPNLSMGPFLLVLLSILFSLFSPTVLVGRCLLCIITCAFVVGVTAFLKLRTRARLVPIIIVMMVLDPLGAIFDRPFPLFFGGEVPAAMLFVGSLVAFELHLRRKRLAMPLGAILFGLAVSTKPHFLLALPVVLAVLRPAPPCSVAQWFRCALFAVGVAGIVAVGCTAAHLFYSFQSHEVFAFLDLQRRSLAVLGFVYQSSSSAWYHLRAFLTAAPALPVVILLHLVLRFRWKDRSWDWWLVGLAVPLVWYVFYSVGWYRYSLIVRVIGYIFSVGVVLRLFEVTFRRSRTILFLGLAACGCFIQGALFFHGSGGFTPAKRTCLEQFFIENSLVDAVSLTSPDWDVYFADYPRVRAVGVTAHYTNLEQMLRGGEPALDVLTCYLVCSDTHALLVGNLGNLFGWGDAGAQLSGATEPEPVCPGYHLYRIADEVRNQRESGQCACP